MPVAAIAPFIGPALGIAGAALGRSGNQGGRNSSGSSQGSREEQSAGTRQSTSQTQYEENPLLGPFREMLMGSLGGAIRDAQQPVFGPNQVAQQLQSINSLTDNASQALSSRLARSGALNSGRAAAAQTDLESNRANQVTGFLGNLPFLEAQAQQQRLQPLLNLGLGFTGRGPTDVTRTGQSAFDSSSNQNFDQQSTGNTQFQGPGFGRALAGEAALGLPLFAPGLFPGPSGPMSPTATPGLAPPGSFNPLDPRYNPGPFG